MIDTKSLKKKKDINFTFITKILYLFIYFVVGVYAMYSLIASGVVPSLYLVVYSLIYLVVGAISWALLFKVKSKMVMTSRILGILIPLILASSSVYGVSWLNSAMSTIGALTSDEDVKPVSIESAKPFNIYISGIDTYGDISTRSRSDVNIVATVNPQTRKVLLTTIPRDSYVPIALGGADQPDKLTHAGNYGVESSMKTVANLLDTNIDAYIRVNFTSFIGGIDELGGITVNNPVAFSSYGEKFEQGEIYLTGKRALTFARERKTLEGGDHDRGKNQQRVIEGVIKKVSSIRNVDDFNKFLAIVDDSVQTNLSDQTIKSLISNQLAKPMPAWTTESVALTGRGQTGGLRSHAMPGSQLYMYVLDQNSVDAVRQQIAETLKQQ